MDRFVLVFLIFLFAQFDRIRTENFEQVWRKRTFVNRAENQREHDSLLEKRQRLARMKFEEHCEPKGKVQRRICPTVDRCLSRSSSIGRSEDFESRTDAHQFLGKRLFFSSFITKNDDFEEKNVDERRRKAFVLYEDYCESTDRLPRACPSIDRCQCTGDCDR